MCTVEYRNVFITAYVPHFYLPSPSQHLSLTTITGSVKKLLSAQLGAATLFTNTHTVFYGNIQDIKMLLGY